MSGHSKWANIKHRKAAQDSKRGKLFTKLIKEITVCAREVGGDPNASPRLRTLLDKARQVNMPADNITRAIKKGTGELPGVLYERQTYEGYGPHGIAVMVETLTDNKNRSVAEVRHVFSAKGGNLAAAGAVSWMFERLGVIRCSQVNKSEDELLEALLNYDIKDLSYEDNLLTVTCAMAELDKIKMTLKEFGANIESAELEWVAKNLITLDETASNKMIEFLETLDELEDVQNVYSNLA